MMSDEPYSPGMVPVTKNYRVWLKAHACNVNSLHSSRRRRLLNLQVHIASDVVSIVKTRIDPCFIPDARNQSAIATSIALIDALIVICCLV